jgi:hypothetical protein
MSNGLETFNAILNLDLRPWMVNYSQQKYQQLSKELQKESYQHQPLYDVAFIKAVNEKRKYYRVLIENAAIKFLNHLHHEIETALITQEKTHWVTSTLEKKLKPKFTEVRNIIEKKNYVLTSTVSITNDDTYIIQFLKYELIRLYLEVQDSYKDQIEDELTEEDILVNFFFHAPFDKPFITAATRVNLPNPKAAFSIQPDQPEFMPLKNDFREPKKGIMEYMDVIRTPGRFAQFEEQLFLNQYIDDNYQALNTYGKMQEMGGIFHVLITKGYFNKKNFKLNKPINPRAICKFLEHRYNTSLDKQFRFWNNKPNELADLIGKYYWLENLPLG